MTENDQPVAYPYEFDARTRVRARELSGRSYRAAILSTALETLVLVILLALGIAERYALLLRGLPWQASAALFTLSAVLFFFLLGIASSYWRYRLRKEYGVSTQGWTAWLWDQFRGLLLSSAFSIPAALFLLYLISSGGVYWWLEAAAAFIFAGAAYSRLFPLLFARFFYRIRPMHEGEMKERVRKVLSRLGLERMEVFTMNESSRSGNANAFVTGLGRGRKIVLFDNLLEKFAPPEVESILAHELGHYVRRDTAAAAAIGVGTALSTAFIMSLVLRPLLDSGAVYSVHDPSMLLWLLLAAGAFQFALSPLLNMHSRRVERRADLFALGLTGDPVAFISGEKRLCDINMMDDSVRGLRKILFASHPPTADRIADGERWSGHKQDQV